jgi:hypothetical protein
MWAKGSSLINAGLSRVAVSFELEVVESEWF